jgi:PAS domain S-box-containing protein
MSKHQLLLKIFETSPVAIVVLNRDGMIYMANPQAEKTLNLKRNDLTQRSFDDKRWTITDFEGNKLPSEKNPFAIVKNTGNPISNSQVTITLENGSHIFLNINAAPFIDDRGEFDGIIAYFEDITEQKRMEERIRHSEKMEAIGQIAGGIAHDFNNQLTGILGFTDLLLEEVRNNATMTRYTNNIFVCGRRAADLTNKLLAFARKGQYISVLLDLHHIIAEVVCILERSINKNIIIMHDLNADPSTIQGDPSQLQNSILNLALNARDAMPEGGKLTIVTDVIEVDELSAKRMMFDVAPGTYVKVSVSDTGIGIDPAISKRIFEPFFTTKEEGKGTGLGLSAVYGTVKNHRGGIAVQSMRGVGATFSLYFPLSKDDAGPTSHDTVVDKDAVFPGKHVLIVDDEEPIRQLGALMMSSMGCRVTTCNDGNEALAIYQRMGNEIDAVILDLVMPVMDGLTTFRALKELNPHVRVLLSSGYSVDGDARKLLKEGAAGFLQKPFGKAEFVAKLSTLFRS